MRVELLGGFRVSVGTRTVGEGAWRLKKAANLVKLLALAPGHRIHRERAMGLLWPKLGRRAAANNLYQALHAARRAFEAAPEAPARYLDYRGEQLVMCPEGELWVDVEAFEEAAKAARRARRLPGGAGAVRGTPAGGPLRGVGGGLVEAEKRGQKVYYECVTEGPDEVIRYLERYRAPRSAHALVEHPEG